MLKVFIQLIFGIVCLFTFFIVFKVLKKMLEKNPSKRSSIYSIINDPLFE